MMATTDLAQRLAALIDGDDPPVADAAALGDAHHPPHAAAPAGSTGWTAEERAALVDQLLHDASIGNTQHPGITRSRLRTLLPDHRKAHVDAVLQWFEAAQVLAPPITPHLPFRHPRRLISTTPADLLNRLNAAPHPICNAGTPAQQRMPTMGEAPQP